MPITTEGDFRAGPPKFLFEWPFGAPDGGHRSFFDVSPDGKRFLMIRETGEAGPEAIHVVLNWFEELKRLVPVDEP